MSAVNPVRFPDARAQDAMTRRAWWLVGLNILVPGSVQVLAGNRRLGRFGLSATMLLWGLLVITGLAYLFSRAFVLTIVTNPIALTVLQVLLAFYAVLWIILTIDTLRLVRLVRTAPSARGFIAGLAILSLAVLAGGAGYGALVSGSAAGLISSVFSNRAVEPPVDGRYNILLLGGDAGPDRDGLRPDSISVVSIDAETGAAVIIGLPRDLENVPFPADSPLAASYPNGYGVNGCDVDACMLNSIYTEVQLRSPEMYPRAVDASSSPGIEGMRDAAEGVTGLTIQYFVLIDMQGFATLIDAVGGITVTVPERVNLGINGGDVIGTIEAGEQRMDGATALWYARTRYQTSDYQRMERQRIVQEALLAQADPANVLSKFQDIAAAGAQVVKTDVSRDMLGYFVDLASKTRALPLEKAELIPQSGVDPQDPDYTFIRELIAQAIERSSPTPAD